MSALLEDGFVPAWPERLPRRPALRLVPAGPETVPAGVRALPSTAPVRLTRRGTAVLAAAVAVLAVVLVWVAELSAPSSADSTPPALPGNSVAVAPGDTLWSIATRVAPDRDPRAEVALLERLNRLRSPNLVPGQVLRVRR